MQPVVLVQCSAANYRGCRSACLPGPGPPSHTSVKHQEPPLALHTLGSHRRPPHLLLPSCRSRTHTTTAAACACVWALLVPVYRRRSCLSAAIAHAWLPPRRQSSSVSAFSTFLALTLGSWRSKNHRADAPPTFLHSHCCHWKCSCSRGSAAAGLRRSPHLPRLRCSQPSPPPPPPQPPSYKPGCHKAGDAPAIAAALAAMVQRVITDALGTADAVGTAAASPLLLSRSPNLE